MITLETLVKKSDANKTTLDNTLREELHSFILFYLNSKKFFFEGVLQGGTSLRIVYGNHRFSEDMDFVFVQKDSRTFQLLESLIDDITKQIQKWFPYIEVVSSKWQKSTDSLKRYQIRVNCKGLVSSVMIQLEFVNVPAYDLTNPMLHYDVYSFSISVESLEEILMDKMVAFGLRAYIKGRDIWDIYFLKNDKNIDISYHKDKILLENKLTDYGVTLQTYKMKMKSNIEIFKEKGPIILKNELIRFFNQDTSEITKTRLEEIVRYDLVFLNQFLLEIENEH